MKLFQLLTLLTIIILSLNTKAATTGAITIAGAIPANTALILTPDVGYNSLSLTAGVTSLRVAVVREINNTPNGYTVSLSSANNGKLHLNLQDIAYTATYNASAVVLSTAGVIVTNQNAQTTPISVAKDFRITFPATDATLYMQGTYSDTLTFTITAK